MQAIFACLVCIAVSQIGSTLGQVLTPGQYRFKLSKLECEPIEGHEDKIQPCYSLWNKKLVDPAQCHLKTNSHCCLHNCRCIMRGGGKEEIPKKYQLEEPERPVKKTAFQPRLLEGCVVETTAAAETETTKPKPKVKKPVGKPRNKPKNPKPAVKKPVRKPTPKPTVKKPVRKPTAKPAAKKPVRKPTVRKTTPKPITKKPMQKPGMRKPKKPTTKPTIKKPAVKKPKPTKKRVRKPPTKKPMPSKKPGKPGKKPGKPKPTKKPCVKTTTSTQAFQFSFFNRFSSFLGGIGFNSQVISLDDPCA